MGLYKVLLVDDEEDIRVGISRKMDWSGLGFELVGEAENGRDALELAESVQPDVVLTDIKMPFMDGLELCSILTKRLPGSKFVVFSGFDDFEYAKQAVRMNVSEYILKPINAAELSAVLQKLKEQLDTERTERQNQETLRDRYEESLPVLRSLFLSRLLEGRVDRTEELAARYDVDLSGPSLAAALVHIHAPQERRELLSLSVQQLFEENLSLPGCVCRPFLYKETVALLASLHSEVSIYDFIAAIGRVCSLSERYLGVKLTVGVGTPCATPEELPKSAAGARSALDYRSLVGKAAPSTSATWSPDAGVRPRLRRKRRAGGDCRREAGQRPGGPGRGPAADGQAPGLGAVHGPVQPLFPGASHMPSQAHPQCRAGAFRGVRFRIHRRRPGHGLRHPPGPGGLVRGAVPADPGADPPAKDRFRRGTGAAGQAVHQRPLCRKRPLRGAAVRPSPSESGVFFHPLQAGGGHELYRLRDGGADGGGGHGPAHHRGKDLPHCPQVRL